MSNTNNHLINSAVCYIPVILLLLTELLYDKNYFMRYLFKRTPKGRVAFALQYLVIIILATMIFMYNYFFVIEEKLLQRDDENKLTSKTVETVKRSVLVGLLFFIIILIICIILSSQSNNKIKFIVVFFIYSVILLCSLSYVYERVRVFKNTSEQISMLDFLGKGLKDNKYEKVGISTILPGLVFGLVFGFIDNAGLISGLDALDSPFGIISRFLTGSKVQKGGSNELVNKEMMEGITAGLGNLFSDGLGVSIGAFFGKLASSIFPSPVEQPIWVDMVGISLGCILGIAIPLSIKNLSNGNMWANGIMSFRFIKDLIVILFVLIITILLLIMIPEKAKKELEKSQVDV